MAKKYKIPKKVVGFNVPKQVRKSPILKMLLGSETGRRILGEALVAGAAAAAAVLAGSKREEIAEAGEGVAKTSRRAGNIAVTAMQDAAGAMTHVIGDAARELLPAGVVDPKGKSKRRDRDETSRSRH
jgi:hypothetical protein